jgi:hypothetical protein
VRYRGHRNSGAFGYIFNAWHELIFARPKKSEPGALLPTPCYGYSPESRNVTASTAGLGVHRADGDRVSLGVGREVAVPG